MSFGFSVGDIIAIGQLTWTVYRACKDAPGEFQELARELSTLHTILHELEDDSKSPNSLLNRRGQTRKAELNLLLRNLSDVLKEIEEIVNRYHSLGGDQKKTWDRVKFASRDVASLRGKIQFHINAINLFVSSLSAGSLARIEALLEQLVKDIKAGRKEPSIISTSNHLSASNNDEDISWNDLERELVGDGIRKQDIEIYKDDIKTYLLKLIRDGRVAQVQAEHTTISSSDGPSNTHNVRNRRWPPTSRGTVLQLDEDEILSQSDEDGAHYVRNRRRPRAKRAKSIPWYEYGGELLS